MPRQELVVETPMLAQSIMASGISYGENLGKVKRVARDAIGSIEGRERSRDVELYFGSFVDSSIDFGGVLHRE